MLLGEFVLTDAWTWFVYYGFALAEEKYLGKQRDRPWAQRHSGKAGIRWQHPRWRVGLNLHYRSGWATTSVIRNPSQLPSEVFESTLPVYFTLDAHVSRIIRAPRGEVEVYLDVMNLTNRDNVGGYDYTTFDDRDAQNLLPLTPVLGVLWRW